MLRELLPDDVVAEETIGTDPTAFLLTEEQPMVARAVESRVREVTNARTCARRALRIIGLPDAPILRGPKGQPLWPAGIIGSITHTKGYYAAAVARSGRLRSVGIDAEVHDRLPDGVLEHIAFGPEREWVAARADGELWRDRLLFSAKESVYKTWFPLTGRWLGFEDAALTVDPVARTFHARILVDGTTVSGPPIKELSGRFLVRDGFVLTAIVLPSE